MHTIRPVADLCRAIIVDGAQHDGVVEFGCEPRMGGTGTRIACNEMRAPHPIYADRTRDRLRRPTQAALRADAWAMVSGWTAQIGSALGMEVDYVKAITPPRQHDALTVQPLGPILRDLICTSVPPDVLGRGQASIMLFITMSDRGCTIRPTLVPGADASAGPARVNRAIDRAVRNWLTSSAPLFSGRITLQLRFTFEAPTGHERMAIAARRAAQVRGSALA